MDDEYVDAYLKANGIDMAAANERLRKIVDAAKARAAIKESRDRCPRCDGTGRYRRFGCRTKECAICNGTGLSPRS